MSTHARSNWLDRSCLWLNRFCLGRPEGFRLGRSHPVRRHEPLERLDRTRELRGVHRRSIRLQAGFSLVEVSLILMVMAILAAVLVPVVSSTLAEARLTAARTALQELANGLNSFLEDVRCKVVPQSGTDGRSHGPSSAGPVGPAPPVAPPPGNPSDPGRQAGAEFESPGIRTPGRGGLPAPSGGSPCAVGKICGGPIVELLVTSGDVPGVGPEGDDRWARRVDGADVDFFEYYLVSNAPGNDDSRSFPTPEECPGRGLGRFNRPSWRGAYVSAPLGPDPWGNRYMSNVEFLEPGGVEDVVILSAGPDEEVDSAFARDGFVPGDDDLIVLFSPGRGPGKGKGRGRR